MEFPNIGKKCNFNKCKQLDFLPIVCKFCTYIFCKEHFTPAEHNCEHVIDKIVINQENKTLTYECSEDECIKTDPIEMKCILCHKHFCLRHRYHDCFDIKPSETKREKYQAPKLQFRKAKDVTDKTIEEKLSKAKNRALANKIKLMKLKGKAFGENTIPVTDRIFLNVAPPIQNEECKDSRPVFISKTWTLGKSIDSIAKRLKIANRNNEEGPKLRLFDVDGLLISSKMEEIIQNLLNDGSLVDGDNLILEFMEESHLEDNKLTFVNDVKILDKYRWK